MNYDALKNGTVSEYRVNVPCGGLNLRDDPSQLSDSHLTDTRNVWYSNGVITTRPGISFDPSREITAEDGVELSDVRFTGATVYIQNKAYRIVYSYSWIDEGRHNIDFYFLSTEGELVSAGQIILRRVDYQTFYMLDHLFVTVAEPTKGGGIYAFVTLDSYGEKAYNIYEINSNMQSWLLLQRDDCHIPTVLVNGRGNCYGTAALSEDVYDGEPYEPEELNMLTPDFKAYFSSDGVSYGFQLPIGDLDNSRFTCRIYLDPTTYTDWIVAEDQSETSEIFFGNTVKMQLDRKLGYISFSSNSVDYPIPKMAHYRSNNIYIFAAKSIPDGRERIIGSSSATVYHSRICVCGNETRRNEVYMTGLSCPLFFPKNAKATVGELSGGVTALAVIHDKLVAFKPSEMYRLRLTAGGQMSVKEVLANSSQEVFQNDELEVIPINLQIGCDCPDTIQLCSNRLIWATSSGSVYMLVTTTYGKENSIFELSSTLGNTLTALSDELKENGFAVDSPGYYILSAGRYMFVLDYRIKEFGWSEIYSGIADDKRPISWYRWEVPDDFIITSGVRLGNNVYFAGYTEGGMIGGIADLSQDADVVPASDGYLSKAIRGGFRTSRFDFKKPEVKKQLEEAVLSMCGSGVVSIYVSQGKHASKREIKLDSDYMEPFRSAIFMPDGYSFDIAFEIPAGAKVGEMLFRYREREL